MDGSPQMLKQMIPSGDMALLTMMIEKCDCLKFGDELLQTAIQHEKKEVVSLLLAGGADISLAPERVKAPSGETDAEYRKAPFDLQAVRTGNIEILEIVLKA